MMGRVPRGGPGVEDLTATIAQTAIGSGAPRKNSSITPLFLLSTVLLLSSCQSPAPRERPGVPDAEFPVGYSIGAFDDRFGISREEFLRVAGEAKELWEKAAGRPLFRREEGGPLALNLVYDDRQRRTVEAGRMKSKIDERGESYDALVWQHERRSERLAESQRRYDAAADALRKRFDEHNARVSEWNDRGGAPPEEFARLQRTEEELRRDDASLERLRGEVNGDVEAVNALAAEINRLADEHNLDVTLYNGKFVETRAFEQGVYSGREITIYQFRRIDDLRIALAHEFGHALGFGHVDDPAAVMHYKLGRQEMNKPALAAADLGLLREKFGRE